MQGLLETLAARRRLAAEHALDSHVFDPPYQWTTPWEFQEAYLDADVWACSVFLAHEGQESTLSRFYVRFARESARILNAWEGE